MAATRLASIGYLEGHARAKLGVFTAGQARAWGVSQAVVGFHNGPHGRWQRVLPGIYELVGLPPDPHRPLLAALLWAGGDAVLSHRAAGWVLGLDGIGAPTPELWTPRTRAPAGVTVHRGTVSRDETGRTGLLRHTRLVRTVLDLATTVDEVALELVVESALRRFPSAAGALTAAAASGRRGSVPLQRVLTLRPPGAAPTESELETRYLQVVRKAGLPPPVRQNVVRDDDGRYLGRLDICWPQARLWVELDSRAWHDLPFPLYRDRRKQNEVGTWLGWMPLRFTWRDVVRTPEATGRLTWEAYQRGISIAPSPALRWEITSM